MTSDEVKNKKLKEKIRKLLALSSSPNESEAALALLKAKELLAKNQLEIGDIQLYETVVKEFLIARCTALNPWEEKLIACIASVTFTEVIILHIEGKQNMKIVGRESNAVTAKILYEYLHETVERKAALFQQSIRDLESFRIGMIESIKKKFKQKKEAKKNSDISKNQLVVLEKESKKDNLDFINRKYGEPNERENWYGVDEHSFGIGKSIG